jgi:hypothetical protein
VCVSTLDGETLCYFKTSAIAKAEDNRQLQALLRNSTRGAVERKHRNISAILIELRYSYVGVPPPVRQESSSGLSMQDRARHRGTALRRNYLELEARNRSLGRAGEELVLEFEHQRLLRAGKRQLADRIEQVARTQGDGLGFEIHSFELDGRDRLIEVKTTRFGALTPFFASRNEVEVSDERQNVVRTAKERIREVLVRSVPVAMSCPSFCKSPQVFRKIRRPSDNL